MNSEYLINEICKYLCINVDDFKSKTRRHHVLKGRQYFYKILKEKHNVSLSKIAYIIGKGHSTIINALMRFEQYYETDKRFKEQYDNFIKYLNE